MRSNGSNHSSNHQSAEQAVLSINNPFVKSDPFILVSEDLSVDNRFCIEKDVEKIIERLEDFRASLKTNHHRNHNFPAVCLAGLGRCGSNIALEVATLVHRAKDMYMDTVISGDETDGKHIAGGYGIDAFKREGLQPIAWLKSQIPLLKIKNNPEFLIEPVVMLGDLDVDIAGRIKSLIEYQDGGYLKDYSYLKIMDLSEVHAGGAGHAPILGQYLAKIILNKNIDSFLDKDWKNSHAYLIDSCGIRANQTRLYFYIFSAGGGTGSGMASEFGLAQQYAYMQKTFEVTEDRKNLNSASSFVYEPIFSCGIAVLPNMPSKNSGVSEALHMNAGRMLCKYFSEEWRFSYSEGRDDDSVASVSAKKIIRPWNAMMMISNDIMRYAEEGDNNGMSSMVDVRSMEKYANQYISQQVFNILTAQSVTTDYDENYFKKAGVDISETIRLDANDLFMSMAGPVAVSYSETVIDQLPRHYIPSNNKKKNETIDYSIDIDDLFLRSIDLPHFNKYTQAIEGVSVLPMAAERYRAALQNYKDSKFDPLCLNQLRFFKNCASVISIVSVPRHFKFSYSNLNRLKFHLDNLFPNTTSKRYALVIGTSASLSLTTLITKSPCLSDEVITLMAAYIKRCFAKPEYVFTDEIEKKLIEMIGAKEFVEYELDEYLMPYENPSKVLDTNWFAIKPMYEKKYKELVGDDEKFMSINDIRLDIQNVKQAIKYLREVYNHRVNKTQMLSLNNEATDNPMAGALLN